MDHAAAHERLADLALEPNGLAALAAARNPEDVALLEHLASCPACDSERAAWLGVQASIVDSLGGPDVDLEPIDLPADLRARVLAVAEPPSPIATGPRSRWLRPAQALLAAAAAVALAVGAWSIAGERDRLAGATADAQHLAAVVAAVDRVLAAPGHRVAQLRTDGGATAGSISWSRHDLVVLTTALAKPPETSVYRCWLASGATETAFGEMHFAGGSAYWIGTLDEWATVEIGPESTFLVSLEPNGSGPFTRTGPAVLQADLGS